MLLENHQVKPNNKNPFYENEIGNDRCIFQKQIYIKLISTYEGKEDHQGHED